MVCGSNWGPLCHYRCFDFVSCHMGLVKMKMFNQCSQGLIDICNFQSPNHICSVSGPCSVTLLVTQLPWQPGVLTPAVLQRGVAVVAQLAALAGVALAVIQAAQTLAGLGVAGLRVQHVDVVVALTRLTLSACFPGVSIVTRWALVTASTYRKQDKHVKNGFLLGLNKTYIFRKIISVVSDS